MKTGCLFASLAFVVTMTLALAFGFALEAVLPKPTSVNFEGIGRLAGFTCLILVPAAFVFGYRRQAKRDSQKPRPPENVRPYDASRMKQSIQPPSPQTPNDHNG
jgi:hypothetical protein